MTSADSGGGAAARLPIGRFIGYVIAAIFVGLWAWQYLSAPPGVSEHETCREIAAKSAEAIQRQPSIGEPSRPDGTWARIR